MSRLDDLDELMSLGAYQKKMPRFKKLLSLLI